MIALLMPRGVGGLAAGVSPASPAVTPGMIRNGTPAALSASASSPPRPNTHGSPPLSRKTRFPARASSMGRLGMSPSLGGGQPPRFPANFGPPSAPPTPSPRPSTHPSSPPPTPSSQPPRPPNHTSPP